MSCHSTRDRGIYHCKNEGLAGGRYNRMHVICGDTLSFHMAMWLTVATTCLVAAMVDGGLEPGKTLTLSYPVAAMNAFAHDPTCRVRVPLVDGRRMSAVEI